ncbi:hypothetical protein J437_LFUL016668 [Ladona fulva]|uniref:Uncharacterized protein n=1 Tax=Ladona fulva TaxID=123851 RepID=A0A8K0KIV1_LADFU|nr:hypothetical protein J437_LFUL016668 [Ladona fulva]
MSKSTIQRLLNKPGAKNVHWGSKTEHVACETKAVLDQFGWKHFGGRRVDKDEELRKEVTEYLEKKLTASFYAEGIKKKFQRAMKSASKLNLSDEIGDGPSSGPGFTLGKVDSQIAKSNGSLGTKDFTLNGRPIPPLPTATPTPPRPPLPRTIFIAAIPRIKMD